MTVGRATRKRLHVLEKRPLVGVGERPHRPQARVVRGVSGQRLLAVADDLVVDVGQVHARPDPVAGRLERAPEQVLEEERAQVADVDVVVDGRPAVVDRDLARHDRGHRFHAAGEGVEERDGAQVGHTNNSLTGSTAGLAGTRGLRASGFGLRATGFGLRASGYGLRASGYGLRAPGYGLRATGFGPWTVSRYHA